MGTWLSQLKKLDPAASFLAVFLSSSQQPCRVAQGPLATCVGACVAVETALHRPHVFWHMLAQCAFPHQLLWQGGFCCLSVQVPLV